MAIDSHAHDGVNCRPGWIRPVADGVIIALVIQASAKATSIVGEHGGFLKLKIAAPPVDGAANLAIIRYIADALSVRKKDVELVRGATEKRKLLHVRGAQVDTVLKALLNLGVVKNK